MSQYIKPYDEEFKKQSVKLLLQSGRPLKVVARELGISDTTLRKWRISYNRISSRVTSTDKGKVSRRDLERQIKQLENENEYLKRQREILKKAVSIVSEEPNEGMR
jgi:transposase-like protein